MTYTGRRDGYKAGWTILAPFRLTSHLFAPIGSYPALRPGTASLFHLEIMCHLSDRPPETIGDVVILTIPLLRVRFHSFHLFILYIL